MLKATQLLLSSSDTAHNAPLLQVINRHGSQEDIQALYRLFLNKKDPVLLAPIMFHGDTALAEDLFKNTIQDNRLQEDFPVETFYALSYLGHEATEHILFDLYKQIFDGDLDWELHRVVCLSLLNYSCHTYKAEIESETKKCFDVHLFPEFIPVLACKTGNLALADRLYEHGSTKASSDASAGLILGISLFGEAYSATFKSIIWNPDWEAASSSTGNRHYTLMGMRYLNITFQELFHELQLIVQESSGNTDAAIYTFCDLLEANLQAPDQYPVRAIQNQREPFSKIFQEIFEGTVSIVDLVEKRNSQHAGRFNALLQELYARHTLYLTKAQHELELLCYTPEIV